MVVLLNLIGFLFYIAAFLCAIGVFVGFSDKTGFKIGIIALIVGILLIFGGYYIRQGASALEKSEMFAKSLRNGDKDKVVWQFRSLSDKQKNKYIEDIYNNFYGDSFSEKICFIEDFDEERIPFVIQKKETLNNDIEELYLQAEKSNNPDSWLFFSSQVPGKFFLKHAKPKLLDREFRKWCSDEDALQRVLLMDSIVMAKEYLSRFENGTHIEDAKRIILNHSFDTYSNNKPPYKITDNFDGTTTLSIQNSSSVEINVNYSGTFANGNVKIPRNGSATVTVPNGYYRIHVSSYQSRAKSENSLETFSGGYRSLNYHIVRE